MSDTSQEQDEQQVLNQEPIEIWKQKSIDALE